jgi:hypothetical protein
MIISTPVDWFPFRDKIASYLVKCLHRNELETTPRDFEFVKRKNLTRLRIYAADYKDANEQVIVERCLDAINSALGKGSRDPFIVPPTELSTNEKRDLKRLGGHRRTQRNNQFKRNR